MALTVNDNKDPQPQSSYQESGFDGFSADMVHNFINNEEILTKSDLSGMKSSVRPITDTLSISEKVSESELQEEPAGKDGADLAIENNFSSIIQLCPEEEKVRFLPRSDPDPERAEESDSFSCLEVENEANQANGSAVVPKRNNKTRNGRYRKAKIIGCLAVVLVILVVGGVKVAGLTKESQPKSSGSENNEKNGTALFSGNCFTCADNRQCKNLISIYRHHDDDNPVYQRKPTEAFPPCDEMTPPATSSCSVCDDHGDVHIYCSEDLKEFQAESSNGGRIKNLSNNCTLKSEPPQTGNN